MDNSPTVEHASDYAVYPICGLFAGSCKETMAAESALDRKDGPCLLLTRQNVPMVNPEDDSLRRCYILAEPSKTTPDAFNATARSEYCFGGQKQ
jgi:transketolase